MAVGRTHAEGSPAADARPPHLVPGRARRRPVRLVVTFVIAGGLAIIAGCGSGPDPVPAALHSADSADALATPARPTAELADPETTDPATTSPRATTSTAATSTPDPTTEAADPARRTLSLGDTGPLVRDLQKELKDLGYWLEAADGHYGQLTRQAVMAFQKAEDLTRDGVAGPRTRALLPNAERPEPRSGEDDVLEIDLDRQLLLLVRDGELKWAFNTSTGNGEAYDRPSGGAGVAHTPRGEFEIEREIDGIRRAELGDLYRPKYFHGGIAVHGSGSVPARPASHGCVRLTNAAMDLLWSSGDAEIGTAVVVY